MKKSFLIFFSALFIISCGEKSKNVNISEKETDTPKEDNTPSTGLGAEYTDMPDITFQLSKGDIVLVPNPNVIQEILDVKSGKAEPYKGSAIYYKKEVVSSKAKSSVIKFVEEADIDHRFVIPIPKGQKAKKGDIIVTWLQTDLRGTSPNLIRAIVTDDSDPTMPKVIYLNEKLTDEKFPEYKIAANSFFVLKEDFMPGATVAAKGKFGMDCFVIVSVKNDKLLIKSGSGQLSVNNKSECTLMPLKPLDYKKDDKIQFSSTVITEGTIVENLPSKGVVKLKYQKYSSKPEFTEIYMPYGYITKGLDLSKK
jgi:hypothetical protein